MKKADVIGLGVAAVVVGGIFLYERSKTANGSSSTTGSSSGAVSSAGTGSVSGSSASGPASLGVVPDAQGGYLAGAGTSPYGNSPSVTPTNCPSGYMPSYVDGYGWTCFEPGTPTQQFLSGVTSIETQAQASGDPLSTYGTGVSGANAQADALALASKLQAQYGGQWQVWLQNGNYSVYPTSRVAQLQAIPGANLGSLITTVGTASTASSTSIQTTAYSTTAGSASEAQVQAAQQTLTALNSQYSSLNARYQSEAQTLSGLQAQLTQLRAQASALGI